MGMGMEYSASNGSCTPDKQNVRKFCFFEKRTAVHLLRKVACTMYTVMKNSSK